MVMVFCEFCGLKKAERATYVSWNIHLRSHDNRYFCCFPGCNSDFASERLRDRHVSSKKYQHYLICGTCGHKSTNFRDEFMHGMSCTGTPPVTPQGTPPQVYGRRGSTPSDDEGGPSGGAGPGLTTYYGNQPLQPR